MNELTFATKRAYQGFLRLTRKGFASVGITAARFDMLLAIRGSLRRNCRGPGVMQYELVHALGVCKSVVSRMLGSLEKLGLVERFFDEDDQRYLGVSLTDRGESVFFAARDLLMRAVRHVVVTAVCFGQRRARSEQQARVHWMRAHLSAMRVYFGDRAPLEYDWAAPDRWNCEYGAPAAMLREWTPHASVARGRSPHVEAAVHATACAS
jgi:DNA-binding MarR family transcriptional regulator